MNSQDYIKNYFSNSLTNLNNKLLSATLSTEEKDRINIRIQILHELEQNLSWETKTKEDKQSERIQRLASMRKSDALHAVIAKQEKCIRIYETISSTIPFINALNLGEVTAPILTLCKELSISIDISGPTFRGDFPNLNQIENTFKKFLDVALPAQSNGGMFKEAYEKNYNLYLAFTQINNNPPIQ